MNNQRRKVINELFDKVCDVRSQLEEIQMTLSDIRDEEQEAMDCIPENLQGSERYEQAEEAVDNLDNAVYGLDDVISSLNEVLDSMTAATE